MDAKTGFFYLFSVVLLFAAFRVVTARNPVHAVLNLILAFSQVAFWRVIGLMVLGLPFGLAMARSEGKRLQAQGAPRQR